MLKKELKQLIHLAWPLLIAQVTQTLMGVADTIMAGRYSATDMAAVAIGFSITMPVLFFIQGIILALPPIVSRLQGGKQGHLVANATQQTFYLVMLFALIAFALSSAVPWLFSLVDMDPEMRDITSRYVQFILYSAPAFTAYQVLRNYCEGLSVTKPTMVIMVIGLLVNIPANYVFIYGKFGVPAMGGVGCGVATMLVFIAMFIATMIYTWRSPRFANTRLYQRIYRPDIAQIKSTLRLGFPIAMTILFEVTLFGVVALLLAPFGATTVAAHQVALNFSSVMFMLPLSIGMATSIRVGHILGEEQPVRARVAVNAALLLGTSVATFTALMTILLRVFISRLYTEDIQVIELAASLMFLAALFQFSDAIQVISAGALRGYKDTTAMFYITFVAYWLIGLPVGCMLALTDWLLPAMGAAGFWVGFICGLTAAAIMLKWRLLIIQKRLSFT